MERDCSNIRTLIVPCLFCIEDLYNYQQDNFDNVTKFDEDTVSQESQVVFQLQMDLKEQDTTMVGIKRKHVESSTAIELLKRLKRSSSEDEDSFVTFSKCQNPPSFKESENLGNEGVDIRNEQDYYSPHEIACRCQRNSDLLGFARHFLETGVDLVADYGYNVLHMLCCLYEDDLGEAIRILLKCGVDVNSRNTLGMNALHIFLSRQPSPRYLTDVVRVLVKKGIDVNAKDGNGQNALHILLSRKSPPPFKKLINAVRLLIENGIDVNAKDGDGQSALHHFCRNLYTGDDFISVAELFLKNGADVNARTSSGENYIHLVCLHKTATTDFIPLIKFFVVHGLDINEPNTKSGQTALHIICQTYRKESLKAVLDILITNGPADLNAEDLTGRYARDYIRECYFEADKNELLRLLGYNKNVK